MAFSFSITVCSSKINVSSISIRFASLQTLIWKFTGNKHLNEVTCALNLTLAFVKQLYAQSLHTILTDSSLPYKAETKSGILFHRKHHKCIILHHPNKKWLTNAQEKAYISPTTTYFKHSKPENTDLIMLLQCKITHSLDFRIKVPGVCILHQQLSRVLFLKHMDIITKGLGQFTCKSNYTATSHFTLK